MLIDNPVEGMIRGDLLPFEELFKLYHGKVYAVCLRMTGNPSEAEDLSQEATEDAEDGEQEHQPRAEQVERHRTLMSDFTSLPASSRLALKLGLFGS